MDFRSKVRARPDHEKKKKKDTIYLTVVKLLELQNPYFQVSLHVITYPLVFLQETDDQLPFAGSDPCLEELKALAVPDSRGGNFRKTEVTY